MFQNVSLELQIRRSMDRNIGHQISIISLTISVYQYIFHNISTENTSVCTEIRINFLETYFRTCDCWTSI